MNGDTLCTDDADYQHFRRRVHNPLIQKLFLWLPLRFRLRIAAYMRNQSQQNNSSKSQLIMDVNPQAVIDTFQRNQVSWMIHGHTHRPAVHNVILPAATAHRVVLGAWHVEGSMVKVTAESVELIKFPF